MEYILFFYTLWKILSNQNFDQFEKIDNFCFKSAKLKLWNDKINFSLNWYIFITRSSNATKKCLKSEIDQFWKFGHFQIFIDQIWKYRTTKLKILSAKISFLFNKLLLHKQSKAIKNCFKSKIDQILKFDKFLL